MSEILKKSNDKSKIAWMANDSPLYKRLNNEKILQVAIISDTKLLVEYLD